MHEPMVIRLPTSLRSALRRRHFLPGGPIILIHHMSLASTWQHFLTPQYHDADLPNQLLSLHVKVRRSELESACESE